MNVLFIIYPLSDPAGTFCVPSGTNIAVMTNLFLFHFSSIAYSSTHISKLHRHRNLDAATVLGFDIGENDDYVIF
jgi:hypothetical protein